MTEHLGYERHERAGHGSGNSRNGSYPKTVKTQIGEGPVRVPRDRNATFEPLTVPKGHRRFDGPADQIRDDMQAWRNRPLDNLYPVILIDAIGAT